MHSKLSLVFAALLSTILAGPTVVRAPKPQLPKSPSWLENVAVRSNGDLLVTQFNPAPVLYTAKDPASGKATLETVYEFTTITKILGIIETLPDTFVIVGGNATANATGFAGTFSAWEVKFSKSVARTKKIADIPDSMFLNGVVSLPDAPHVVLIADSQFGLLFRLDTKSGKHEIIADRPQFKSDAQRFNQTVGFGINGVKIRDGYLYCSNSDLINIYRVPITKDGYIAQGGKAPVELYADLNPVTTFLDDFEIGKDGTLWVVTNSANTVVAVSPKDRKPRVVVGAKDQLTVAGGTGAAFGRTAQDKHVLYVSTTGGLAAPINGTIVEPGKVEGIDTRGC
ncbi:hypothetical protein C7974DRAFT_430523 [Boeremia exigua]|uniref:uncharacterized protein n=1 Tax=Boeremia exigua TaxID=749465 RepID=UPI001E8CA816|nr:uncharacterized protein C7974DRAFT_430523 [Boeremia exigua]KAH6644882.1 hypothetical protein C7974DRAFT_430523 [Boeremia exigua]